jgi:3-dehydroquinate dehydratase/shikimate dehydrogenase
MGELGEVSRVLAPRLGSLLTFGALEAGRESAPGQLTARDLAELYRVRTITDATALYAVVGDPVAHSVSPEIHNTAFRETGLDAAYLRFRVADLAAFLATVRPLALQGLSVTIPHKQAALAASAEVDPLARQAGAVNTLTRTPQGWRGENTDIYGALQALSAAAREGGIELAGAPALLLGAGGAARGIACALQEAGCRLTIANRTAERAARLAEEFGAEAVELADAHRGRYAVVANSTSVGMHPHEEATPIAAEVFGPGMVAFDAVYNPRETRMLREARERGAAIADGVAMFVGQAVRQFELWTGRAAPVAAMERVVVERLTR